MLTPEQRIQLVAAIQNFILLERDIGRVRQLIGPEGLNRVSATDNAYTTSRWILDYSLGQPRPDLFIAIVRYADEAEELGELRQLADQLETDSSLWRSTLADELFVPAEWPFVDRRDLRLLLQAIADGEGPPALVIQAPAGHGKRTMCAYIRQRAVSSGTYTPVVVELRREPDLGVLDTLVADLLFALNRDFALDTTHAEPERQGVVLARLLADEAKLASEAVWLVANVLEPEGIEPGVLSFLDELLACVQQNRLVARRLRVLLLSDDPQRLGLTNLPGIQDRHVLPDVSAQEISEWFAAAAPGKPLDLYEDTANTVLRSLAARQPPSSRRLRWLAHHCRTAHLRLKEA